MLSASHRQFNLQAIFDSSSNAVIAIDRDGVVLMYNAIVEKALLRQNVTVQKGLNIFDLLQGDERAFWFSDSARAMDGERVTVEREYETEEGPRLIRFTVFPLFENDVITGACLSGEDITTRDDAERKLRAANERFRLAADAISSVVYELDRASGRFTATSSFKTLTGFDHEQTPEILRQEWWYGRIHPEDVERVRTHIASADADPTRDRYEVEYRFRHASGQYLYVWHRGVLIKDTHGTTVRVVGSVQDISERKQMEAVLLEERNTALIAKATAEEMSRLKSNFLANMSHELRTPMTAILGFSQLIAESSENEEIRNFASTIESGATRLLETLNALLDHARIEAKNIAVNPTAVNVNVATQEICRLLEPLAFERSIDLHFSPSAKEQTATIDEEHFRAIVTNLIGNAIKFTSQGRVIVHTSFKNDAVKYPLHLERFSTHVVGEHPCCEHFVVSVHDTGTGIAMENLPMIFEEFKQESHGYNRTYEGNGLGLTISSRLALAMGGSIEVQSAKGIGSTFIVRLPLTHESAMSN